MRVEKVKLYNILDKKLKEFNSIIPLPGINNITNKNCLIMQMIDSIRRIEYVTLIKNKTHHDVCKDPLSDGFDPLKAASYYVKENKIDEAFWLIFLATHFGKNLKTKWRLTRDVYAGIGGSKMWTWQNIRNNVDDFKAWLDLNENTLRKNGKFGNHRKFESLNAFRSTGTGAAVSSYINWISNKTHLEKFEEIIRDANGDKKKSFALLYKSMNSVNKFGRTAKFDYLTMVGKLGLLDIEPNSTYMDGSTGPIKGARRLFGNNKESYSSLENKLAKLESHLDLYYGMQVLEDSLCNWQKNPENYTYFGG